MAKNLARGGFEPRSRLHVIVCLRDNLLARRHGYAEQARAEHPIRTNQVEFATKHDSQLATKPLPIQQDLGKFERFRGGMLCFDWSRGSWRWG